MKNTVAFILSLVLAAGGWFPVEARILRSTSADGGGSGPYKAVIVEDDALPGYSIFRPDDLKAAVSVEGPLPVILFGNGGCAHNSVGFYGFLSEIASHGYVIISNGVWTERPVSSRPDGVPRSRPEGAAPRNPAGPGRPAGAQPAAVHVPQQDPSKAADALDLLAKLDWFEAENSNPASEYFCKINTSRAAAMGQSCGGLQALVIGTCGDDRIRTTVALNSGVFPEPYVLEKAVLERLTRPVAYIIGGESDIAYPNAIDDFQRISNVPVSIANLPVGHGGTYAEPLGGQFARMALYWLEWQIRGRGDGEKVFRYCQVPEDLKGWTVHARNFNRRETFDLPHPAATGEENISKNPFGEVSNYSGVRYPSVTVSLADPDKANGSAVLLFPGGGMMALSWESDFIDMANWLNERGIAAIGVKYRTRVMAPRPAAPTAGRPATPPAGARPPQAGPGSSAPARDFSKITGFGVLENANANPAPPQPGVGDPSIAAAAEDCINALRLVRNHAAEWGLDPDRVGVMGFSAGGGVELSGLIRAVPEERPSFVCSVYGPALEDIHVDENFPPLFIAVHADHRNVAAGCLALFMEWKKAGVDAEMHIYGEGTGGLFGGGGSSADRNLRSGSWLESFYSWMHVKNFLTPSRPSDAGWVKVRGNKFIDPQGKELVFRGLCFSDPVKLVREGQWNERYFAEAAAWGANVVRFAVHPTNLNAMGWEETFQAMDQGVEWAKRHGMYVIMDWHSIGNLKEERFTSPMYNTTKEETFKFWRTVARRYKDEPAVALYELFNEPTVTAEGVGDCSWSEWKELQEQIIDTVRTYNPNAVCLCAGFDWAYDLKPVAAAPIARPNVAYVSHPYPMKRSEPWEGQWEKDFGYVADTYPVICTEIGFCLADEPGAHIPVMSTDVYGEHITRYFEQKGISFTVWCFDTGWAPMLISDWNFTPTTQGRFFKAYLQGKRAQKNN